MDLFLIDEPSTPPKPSALRRHSPPPPSITLETVAGDLLALEAVLLLEELKTLME